MLEKKQHKKNLKEFRKLFIEDINRLRQERGLSLDELAEQSHIPLAEICKIDGCSHKNWSTIYQLARFFDSKFRITFY